MIHQPPDDESAKKLCRELVTLIRDGDFDSLLARVDDIKSICVDVNDVGTVDQTIIDDLDLDPEEYSLGLAAAHPKVERDSKGYFPVGHRGRIVELLYRCGYSFHNMHLKEVVLADNIEAFEFLVFVRRLGIEHDDPLHSPEMEIAEMCRQYVPGVFLPSYLPDDLVKHMPGNPSWMTIGTDSSYIWETGQSSRNFSFWYVISHIMDRKYSKILGIKKFPLEIGEWISDETEKPELRGFSTRDLFECAMMSFDGHEYKTVLTGLTEGDNPRLKEKFYACKGEIRAKLDKAAADCDLSEASVARRHYGMSHLTRAQENAVKKFIGSLSSGTSTMNDESHAIPHGKIKVVAN